MSQHTKRLAGVVSIAGLALLLAGCTNQSATPTPQPLENTNVSGDNTNQTVNANTNANGNANLNSNTNTTGAPHKVSITVTGRNFAFSQNEIRVKKGDVVTINFTSTEGFHDWVVDEFNASTKSVNPGTPTSVTFTASKTGTFEYYCSVGQHRQFGMKGNLIVE